MQVVGLWRYPVKSLQGERLDAVDVAPDGLAGDRGFGIVERATGFVLTARREPRLLLAAAALVGDGVEITLPDGRVANDDAALSEWLGRPVALAKADTAVAGTYETQLDFEHEDTADWFSWEGPTGPFHDSTRTRVSLVSEGTIGAWDARRFRANVLLSGDGEDEFVGSTIKVGTVALEVTKQVDRCVMVTRPQPAIPGSGSIEHDLDVLRTIIKDRAGNLAIGALVTHPGTIKVGDAVTA